MVDISEEIIGFAKSNGVKVVSHVRFGLYGVEAASLIFVGEVGTDFPRIVKEFKSMTQTHVGRWICVLLDQDGTGAQMLYERRGNSSG